MIWIAVDAMGGDHAPQELVKGAILGAREYGVGVQLVGQPEAIEPHLKQYNVSGLSVQIVQATEVIGMDESPATAFRKKKDASIIVTAKQVKKGEAQAMVAAGSTGAAMASALFNLGRIDGVDRPAIGVVLPSVAAPCLLLDAGANADCLPEMLPQFARMGSVFMQNVYNVETPRVGLLNIGEEAGKGNSFVNAAFKLLEQDSQIHFIGNVEGRDMFMGHVDVTVCDGFTGNVALKSAEGVAMMMNRFLKDALSETLTTKLGALLAKSAFQQVKKRVDHEEFGGALLLGLQGICVIAHGGSSANAVKNAIRVAKEAVDKDVLSKISDRIRERCVIT
jgi:glycerol-3-phosphate acyltransferase PlsX